MKPSWHHHLLKSLMCRCSCCVWPAGVPECRGWMPALWERPGRGLKCLCSEVICHLRGFPHVGVGRCVGEGKTDFVLCLSHTLFVYMFTIVKKRQEVDGRLVRPPHHLEEFWFAGVVDVFMTAQHTQDSVFMSDNNKVNLSRLYLRFGTKPYFGGVLIFAFQLGWKIYFFLVMGQPPTDWIFSWIAYMMDVRGKIWQG